ncbi:MAG: ArsR family transcriptional regulator, arsenate/arsenite/antimonite-responsive transcriptional [Mycobacterium sp.]|jgi:protein-tyrosine-phosphatase/DNA-binding transcriptional ArsR family regulator|nr:ArsR family transcriptional regulator, arsenate/arsenite/antimonite-responsive transcriptional [Mycobacterium sp.]
MPREVPLFVRLTADPTRWQLLVELASSDRRVRELSELVGQPQNAVSYHLARLRSGGLVSMHRSSADGRDSYYTLDMARCHELLLAAGAALHPTFAHRPWAVASSRAEPPVRVLFLCTGNSGRSQIAEALLQQAAGPHVAVVSAGSHPKPLHPTAVRVMRRYGIDLSERRSKPFTEFTDRRFDYVITLCDRVREVCPPFPGGPQAIHWSIPDPAAAGDARAVSAAFSRTATELRTRIEALLARILPAAA